MSEGTRIDGTAAFVSPVSQEAEGVENGSVLGCTELPRGSQGDVPGLGIQSRLPVLVHQWNVLQWQNRKTMAG